MATQALLVQGMTLEISTTEETDLNPTTPPTMAAMECISREVTYQPATANELDATAICDTAKQFLLGLKDPGTLSITGFWAPGHAGAAAYMAASEDRLSRLIIVTFTDGSEFRATGFAQEPGWGAAVDGLTSGAYAFRLSGPTSVTP